jgi:predicted transcriptional regulator of viral defense system
MEFSKLLEIVQDGPVFDSGLLLAGDADARDIYRQLSRWKQAGKIYQLCRGLYCLAPPFRKTKPHPFLIANRLLLASYVSLQSALAYYGMILEYVPMTISVTTNRPAQWETPVGIFDFRHIQVNFFEGYRFLDLGDNQGAFIASPEKALLDLVYLESGGDTHEYLSELRLNNLEGLNWQLLERLARKIEKPKLLRAIARMRELAGEAGEYEDL